MTDRIARIWNGSSWESITSTVGVPNAISFYQSAEPVSPITGQIWIDSDDSKMYVWSGSSWIAVALDLSSYAPLNSPTFTGTPNAPTATEETNNTQIATTAFVNTKIASVVDSAPSNLNTLNKLSSSIGDDPDFATTVSNSIAERVSKDGGDTITVSSGSTVPLTIQNNGTGNSFVVNDVASDTTPFIIDGSGNVGISTSTPQALLDVKNGTTYSSSGDFLVKIQQNSDSSGKNGLSVVNARASTDSKIFEVARGWNGLAPGYFPVFSIDGLGNVTLSNVESSQIRIKLPEKMTLEAPLVTNAQNITSYTLVLSDAGKLIEMSSSSTNAIIIPTNTVVPFPIGTKIDIIRTGTGECSIAPDTGVTLNSDANKRRIISQWAAASIIKRNTDTWILIGALKT